MKIVIKYFFLLTASNIYLCWLFLMKMICCAPSAVFATAKWCQEVGTFDKYSHICSPFRAVHFMDHFISFVPILNSLYFITENYIRQLICAYSVFPGRPDIYEYAYFYWQLPPFCYYLHKPGMNIVGLIYCSG
jgi:hypothetical protein